MYSDYRDGMPYDKFVNLAPQKELREHLSIFDQFLYPIEKTEDGIVTYEVPGASKIKVRMKVTYENPEFYNIDTLILVLGNEEIDLLDELQKKAPGTKFKTSSMGGGCYDKDTKIVSIIAIKTLRGLWGLFHEARHAQQYFDPEIINLTEIDLKGVERAYYARGGYNIKSLTEKDLDTMMTVEEDANSYAKNWFKRIFEHFDKPSDRDETVINYEEYHLNDLYRQVISEMKKNLFPAQ